MRGKGNDISKTLREAIRRIPVEALKAEEENVRDAFNTIIKFSSGEISAAELAAMGHPYHPDRTPPQDPAIINVQTEIFVNSWQVEGPRVQGDGSILTVFENT